MYTEERWDVIPGAEPSDAFAARARAAVERIAATHPDQRVAVFAHGGIIGQILSMATASRPFAFSGADNASLSHIVVAPARGFVRRFTDLRSENRRFRIEYVRLCMSRCIVRYLK